MIFEIIIALLEGQVSSLTRSYCFHSRTGAFLAKVLPSSYPAAKQALLQVLEAWGWTHISWVQGPLSTADAAAFSARSSPSTAALGFLSLHGSGWALWVAFKCHLPWDLLKCFISAHLPLQGWPLTHPCCCYLTQITLEERLPWRFHIQLSQKNPSFCILLNAAFWGPCTRRANSRGCLHSLQPGVWSPGISLPASLAAPYPFAKPNGLFWFVGFFFFFLIFMLGYKLGVWSH